jgi:uncharacterized protein YqjF (DUF2071 family)
MAFPFLTAHWSNLILATYAVPPELLRPRLPPGLELDTRDGQSFVSLVAFDFLRTRVLGIPWPGYRNFPEVNLRFYVRQGDRRGVTFLREFVPRGLIAWLARLLYNEPYAAAPMRSLPKEEPAQLTVSYQFFLAGRWNTVTATGDKPAYRPAEDSSEHFFKEHHWGFGVSRSGRTLCYEVRHPVWDVYPVRSVHIDVDWAGVYGPEWSFLGTASPTFTALAVGSPIAVYPHGRYPGPSSDSPLRPGVPSNT